jgi:hypothetical protein
VFVGCRDGEVEEPHGSQPVLQGAQERHQEAPQAPPHLHQRGTLFFFFWVVIIHLFNHVIEEKKFVFELWVQMDPKFLRNQRYARKHNNKIAETASEEE